MMHSYRNFVHEGEAPQTVGDHSSRSGQRGLRPFGNGFLGELEFLQADPHGMARLGGLHGGDEGNLVLRAPATLAARQFSAQIGIVDLDTTVKLARLFADAHDLHQFVLEQPGRLIAHAQVTLELQGGDIVLGLAQSPAGDAQQFLHERRAAGLFP